MGVWCILILGNNLDGSETAPDTCRPCNGFSIRLGDSCLVEVARRLRQDAAACKGGTRQEISFDLGQNDALHGHTCAHLDVARDLPEDVVRGATGGRNQENYGSGKWRNRTSYLIWIIRVN
jgi:hypothetical protein